MELRITESKQVSEEIQQIITGHSFNLDDRKTVAVGCFSVSLEHHASLHLLFENKLYGSATALLRSQFESYVKGLWFLYCSPDQQVENVYNDSFNKEFNKIISGLEHVKAPTWEEIKSIKESYWHIMCGFTHTGQPQLARRFKEDNITPNYKVDFLKSVLNLGDFIAFHTVVDFISVSNEETPTTQLDELASSTELLRGLFK